LHPFTIELKKNSYLKIARHIFDFVNKYGQDKDGNWLYQLDASGKVIEAATSIYVDGFVALGLIELVTATGEEAYKSKLREILKNLERKLNNPGSYGTEPYPYPDFIQCHGESMMFSFVFFEAGKALKDDSIMLKGKIFAEKVQDVFLDKKNLWINEFIHLDGSLWGTALGRSNCPGHAIECMWFLIIIFRHFKDEERIKLCCKVMLSNLERAWDKEYGGLYLWMDREGKESWNKFADSKIWWPHTEAMVACLMAHQECGEDWCMQWFKKIHDYSFEKYRLDGGEWTQRLNRDGSLKKEYVALPVKDPFHLPRALMYCTLISRELSQ